MELIKLLALALSSFAVGFSACNIIYVFFKTSSADKRDDCYDKAADSDGERKKRKGGGIMNAIYPNLAGEIAKRGIKKVEIAKQLGISERALYNKLHGLVEFTWPEVQSVIRGFFPDCDPVMLFDRDDEKQNEA